VPGLERSSEVPPLSRFHPPTRSGWIALLAANLLVALVKPAVPADGRWVQKRPVFRPVRHLSLGQIRHGSLPAKDLPFLKRHPFQPEDEVRMHWGSKREERRTLPVPIDLGAISRITLSPWMHGSLADEVKGLLKPIPGCSGLRIYRSTQVGNAEWMRMGDEAR
jgi:hypothetical protein